LKSIGLRMTVRLHGRLAAQFIVAFLLTDRSALASDIVDTLAETRSLSTLLNVLRAAGLEDSLRGTGPYTLFAPTNEAFAALPPGLMDAMMRPENRPQLAATINRHLLSGRLLARDQAGRHGLIATVAGNWLAIDGTAGVLMIDDDVEVLQADIATDNGVIHIIDSVMLQNGSSEAALHGAF
jgi:uncharacterized surface protein with fasciclin (FAS1) repeats